MVKSIGLKVTLAFVLLLVVFGNAAPSHYLYISVGTPGINVYSQNPATGELIYKGTTKTDLTSMSIITNKSKKNMYVGLRGGGNNVILAYTIDQISGLLQFVNKIDIPQGPVHMSLDNNEKFIFSAPYGTPKATISPVGSGGELLTPVVTLTTEKNPHAIKTDKTNKFLYITNLGADNIHRYSFNEVTGEVQPLSPFKFEMI